MSFITRASFFQVASSVVLSLVAIASFLTLSSEAALVSRLGGQAVYDTDLDITWWGDANDNGTMNWNDALSWAANATFGGHTDWRLPETLVPDPTADGNWGAGGFGATGSEMGHLFYDELGGIAGNSILTSGDPDLPKFTNLQSFRYWSATPADTFAVTHSWTFWFEDGFQDPTDQSLTRFAFAIGEGDVFVPEPGTLSIAALGCVVLVARRRRRRRDCPRTRRHAQRRDLALCHLIVR